LGRVLAGGLGPSGSWARSVLLRVKGRITQTRVGQPSLGSGSSLLPAWREPASRSLARVSKTLAYRPIRSSARRLLRRSLSSQMQKWPEGVSRSARSCPFRHRCCRDRPGEDRRTLRIRLHRFRVERGDGHCPSLWAACLACTRVSRSGVGESSAVSLSARSWTRRLGLRGGWTGRSGDGAGGGRPVWSGDDRTDLRPVHRRGNRGGLRGAIAALSDLHLPGDSLFFLWRKHNNQPRASRAQLARAIGRGPPELVFSMPSA
jgi:hypothetical protein